MAHHILLIEDNERAASDIVAALKPEGIDITVCPSADAAISELQRHVPGLVIVDLDMRGLGGMRFCQSLRSATRAPMLALSSQADVLDQIVALEIFADDYLKKPLPPRLLLARVRALLRRCDAARPVSPADVIRIGALTLRIRDREVIWRDKVVPLRTKEFNLLLVLARHAGTILSRDRILKNLRGFGFDGFDRTVDNYIHRLRRHFENDLANPVRIRTIWGEGYLLSPAAWSDPPGVIPVATSTDRAPDSPDAPNVPSGRDDGDCPLAA